MHHMMLRFQHTLLNNSKGDSVSIVIRSYSKNNIDVWQSSTQQKPARLYSIQSLKLQFKVLHEVPECIYSFDACNSW